MTYFSGIYTCLCVYLHIHNKSTQHTHTNILCFILDVINQTQDLQLTVHSDLTEENFRGTEGSWLYVCMYVRIYIYIERERYIGYVLH